MKRLLIFVLPALVLSAVDPPKDDKKVEPTCDMFCAQHFEKDVEAVKQCEQGCNLRSLLQYAEDEAEKGQSGEQCHQACMSGFHTPPAQLACQQGCDHQHQLEQTGKMSFTMTADNPLWESAQGAFSKIWNRMSAPSDFFGESHADEWWPFKEMGNEHETDLRLPATFQETFNRMHQRMRHIMDSMMADIKETEEGDVRHIGGLPSVNGDQQSVAPVVVIFRPHPLEEETSAFFPQRRVDEITQEHHDQRSWMHCLAEKAARLSHVARGMVALALLLCCLCMIWICLVIMRTAPRRRLLATANHQPPQQVATIEKHLMEVEKSGGVIEKGIAPPVYDSSATSTPQLARVHAPTDPPPYQEKQQLL